MPTIPPPARNPGLRQLALYACFALSGLAGLIYQTAWTREFALVFGTSELAVATVLAAYMGGLALGARLIEGLLPRIGAPVRVYAGLEAGIAVAALVLVPLCLRLADAGLVRLFGHQADLPAASSGTHVLYYLLSAFATLMIPTTLMGATLPILARGSVHSEREIGTRIGALYAWNTAGAVCGALLTALVLLPQLGLRATQWGAGGVNLLVCVIALLLIPAQHETASTTNETSSARSGTDRAAWVLPLMALSCAVAFIHEVLWTRLLQRSVGSSGMAFGVMVASFLLGIALGGALGSRLARTRAGATRWWILAQVLIALAATLAWYGRARVAVVPLLAGAGVKLKTVEALWHGVPVVLTPTGAQGLPGVECAAQIATEPAAFAIAVCDLLIDDALWRRRSSAGAQYARERFSVAAQRQSLLRALDIDGCAPSIAMA